MAVDGDTSKPVDPDVQPPIAVMFSVQRVSGGLLVESMLSDPGGSFLTLTSAVKVAYGESYETLLRALIAAMGHPLGRLMADASGGRRRCGSHPDSLESTNAAAVLLEIFSAAASGIERLINEAHSGKVSPRADD